MSNIYKDHTYLKNNPGWHEGDAEYKSGEILRLLSRNQIDFKSVCDIGCGSGGILVRLAAQFNETVQLVGFDISDDAISIARKKEDRRVRFEQKDITEASQQHSFDLLLVIDVIEHLDNYFRFLEKISPIGKYTVFHIPLDMSVWALFREDMLIESKNRVGHIHNFTEKFIESILIDKGFKIIDKIYTEPSFENMTFKQRVVNRIRKILFAINMKLCIRTIGGYSILVLAENNASRPA